MRIRQLLALAALAAPLAVPSASAAADNRPVDSVVATFEGSSIRLADGWGEARACASDDLGTRCYRSESELITAETIGERQSAIGEAAILTCASAVRLYPGTSHTGTALYLYGRYTLYNLATYGFSNVTSSYRIGACSSKFYDGTTGGAPVYPGSTSAHAAASSMLTGWNNRVSSVYIN